MADWPEHIWEDRVERLESKIAEKDARIEELEKEVALWRRECGLGKAFREMTAAVKEADRG